MRLRAIFVSAVLVLSGCTASEITDPISDLKTLEDVYNQSVTWTECEEGFECTTLGAPLDWLNPTDQFIPLALTRKVGSSDKPVIFTNPGGPGVSGITWMQSGYETLGSKELRAEFQLIAFDPRGVGKSAGVVCQDQKIKDQVYYEQSPHSFGSPEDIQYSSELLADFASDCQSAGFDVAYFNTQQAARDLELMRALVGGEQLDYLGFSYGTLLGATYAALFPDRVGNLVLDGAINPLTSEADATLGQVKGFDAAFRAYLAHCVEQLQCPFNGDAASALSVVKDFLLERERETLPTQLDRELSLQATLTGIVATLYSEQSWIYLSQAFEEALDGDGTTFLLLADFYNERELKGYVSNQNEANRAISCADGRVADAEAAELNPRLIAASEVFGKYFAEPQLACIGWPEGKSKVELNYSVQLANPPLVVGTTGDPATPYSQAVELKELLDGATLLTLEADRHTAYGSNICIDAIVEAYFRGQDIGSGDKTCK